MKKTSSFLLIAALLLTTSCAGLISGKTQSVFLRTSDSQEVEAEVVSANGVQNITIPGTVTVPRSKNPLTIKVKEGRCVKSSTEYATTKYNIFLLADVIGGVFGLTGTTIDMSSGAAWAYEDNIYVNVKKKPGC